MTDAFSARERPSRHTGSPYDRTPPVPPSPPSYATHRRRPHPRKQRPGQGEPPTAPGQHGDLRILRGAYRRQCRVAVCTALGYFTLFLVLSACAPSLMTGTVSGGLSAGLLLGLLQVPVTCVSVGLYEYAARQTVDPIADRLRRQAERLAAQQGV
ncbi:MULTISPECIES: DUF485 domain-containing protein [Streptomyces]|uniref:DUF485 domain-containing protein n=1 Tax=Streptomyces TaxID=1883 RepID=UPI0015871F3F|nr:DUF485 domain-containing protein [Streptomyces sp. CAI-85]MBO7936774.1 DUF485 domain-containing protein [Streptomyces sp. S9]NUV61183.1 DUF485 domain-containing protein [Streptomyces sp. CAI-85]